MNQENVAETAQAEVYSKFENITFGGGEEAVTFRLRDLCKDEESYQLVSGFIQRYVGDQAETHAAIVASYMSEIESLEDQLDDLDRVKSEADRLGALLADMTAKRDAAATELLEAKQEIDRLKADNESLRKQLEAKPTPQANVDLLELAKKKRAEEEAAKQGIYNKRWKDELRKNVYLAELSATGETIEIPYLEIGKYREETAEEAARFRQAEAERLAKANMENVEAPALTFQEEDDPVQEHAADGEVASEAVGRDEFNSLEARVYEIEKRLGITNAA